MMGSALYIVPELEVPGFDYRITGKALARAERRDELASAAGVRPLMEFFSANPDEVKAFREGDGVGLPENGIPDEVFYAAEEGLETIRGMLEFLVGNLAAIENREAIVRELEVFESVLSRLASENVRWHLGVDF